MVAANFGRSWLGERVFFVLRMKSRSPTVYGLRLG